MEHTLPPFSCTYSPAMPELLQKLGCTLAISTYQAGKVIFISASGGSLVQLPRNFEKPMGIAVEGNRLAVASRNSVLVLSNSTALAPSYPKQPNTYDALFLPRTQYFTGELDIHDLHWTGSELWAANTRFSCLATLGHDHNFTPQWKPYFITRSEPTDQCHLNGMAFQSGKPKYVTALGQTEMDHGWKPGKAQGGILMDVEKNKIIAEDLPMPHSPRIYDGQLYVLLSATGNLVRIDLSSGNVEILKSLDGFVRGMDRIGDYLFIGLSKLRETSTAFLDLPISNRSIYCGVVAIYLPHMSVAGYLKYENSVEEIYDVRILPGLRRPGLLSADKPEHQHALHTPDQNFWAVPKPKDDLNKF